MNGNTNMFYVRVHRWVGGIFKLFFPLQVEGLEYVTGESVIFCPNHSSAIDPLMMAFALPRNYSLRIMAKKQVMDVPLLGWVLHKLGVFGVDRGNSDIQSVKTAIRALRDGSSLLMFPEGTRVDEGENVDAKGGVSMIAIRSGVKLQPVYIGTKKRLFRKTRIVIGAPYAPVYTGKKGTAEEYQANADEILRQAYQLGETK